MPHTCCFTGHRVLSDTVFVEELIKNEVTRLISIGVTHYLCGMALGFDLLSAKVLLSLKSEYPSLRCTAVIPCPEQAERWTVAQQAIYTTFLNMCDEVITISPSYHKGCMHMRNRYMIDHSDICIAFLSGEQVTGGTASTVAYARKEAVDVINIFPHDFAE